MQTIASRSTANELRATWRQGARLSDALAVLAFAAAIAFSAAIVLGAVG